MAAFAKFSLAAESETSDDLLILFFGAFLDVIQQLAALGNEGQETAAGRIILFMDIHVVRQVEDPLGEEGHLVRGATGVSFVELIGLQVDWFWCFFGAHGRRGWLER